jgi:flavin-binding protein dodecin
LRAIEHDASRPFPIAGRGAAFERTALDRGGYAGVRDQYGRARDLSAWSFQLEERVVVMADGVYRVTEVIGVSSESWEAAARSAVETAAKTVRDLRIAEVIRQDVAIENGTIKNYRVRLAISFKYESSD